MSEIVAALKRLERRQRRLTAFSDRAPLDGWMPMLDETWTYASATTFTIATDATGWYRAGMFVKWTQTTVRYGCITSVAYSAPDTTITIVGDTIDNAAITDNYASRNLSPQGADLGDFDADKLGSGAATDDYVLTADGSGGAAWESVPGKHNAVTLAADADVLLGLSTQELTLDTQTANYVFAGPTSGAAADPTFRALVNADLPGAVLTTGFWSSTSWDGDAKNGASGTIDLSAVFGLPANIKAVAVQIYAQDETAGVYFGLNNTGGYTRGIIQLTQVANQLVSVAGVVTCDANGDIAFYQSSELDNVYIYIVGYWI